MDDFFVVFVSGESVEKKRATNADGYRVSKSQKEGVWVHVMHDYYTWVPTSDFCIVKGSVIAERESHVLDVMISELVDADPKLSLVYEDGTAVTLVTPISEADLLYGRGHAYLPDRNMAFAISDRGYQEPRCDGYWWLSGSISRQVEDTLPRLISPTPTPLV